MCVLQFRWCRFSLFMFVVLGQGTTFSQDANPDSTKAVLETIFSPRRAPRARTMGLVQRSFLDLLEVARPKLEMALVIDGTESMGTAIVGIRHALRQMVEDLQRYKADVSFQIVVFRDEGAPSGVSSFPLHTPQIARQGGGKLRSFTSDQNVLREGVEQIQIESGAPYFPELIDLGIHQALTELNWSHASDVSRWILVFGDAPPFDEGFVEAGSKARRRVATQQLISTAKRLDVRISSVLCNSRNQDLVSYRGVLPKTQQFMNRLATDTGGLMLDLSYADIRNAIEDAARIQRVRYRKIGALTQESIEAARTQATERRTSVAEPRRLRMAVLPHVSLVDLQSAGAFDPARTEVQIAAELRHHFRAVPGAELASSLAVERQVMRFKSQGIRGADLLPALATALRVDYLIWGSVVEMEGRLQIQSVIYQQATGKELIRHTVRSSAQLPVVEVMSSLMNRLVDKAIESGTDPRLAAALELIGAGSLAEHRLLQPVTETLSARAPLLHGFELLEKALAYPAGSTDGALLLRQSRRALELAQRADQQNPLVALLLANVAFNEGQALLRGGQEDAARVHWERSSRWLKSAFARRQQSRFSYLRWEIEADYALLIKKDFAGATRIYERLAETRAENPLHTTLRAHWMLAGIHSGDWGVAHAPDAAMLIDGALVRHHLTQILAHFEESNEAAFIRRQLRWDDRNGKNRFEHFPRIHDAVAEQIR
ncbi:MAG: hypothetical protein CMJ75_15950 [Planctomycetaceae bacterium]|nr:hypothetical protein [Planctomycetaceae bacterium]